MRVVCPVPGGEQAFYAAVSHGGECFPYEAFVCMTLSSPNAHQILHSEDFIDEISAVRGTYVKVGVSGPHCAGNAGDTGGAQSPYFVSRARVPILEW